MLNIKPVRIIDVKFNLLAEVDSYTSLVITRSLFDIGEFELHIESNKLLDCIKIDNLIYIAKNKVGIIESIEIEETDKLSIEIKGSMLKGILSRRITLPAENGYDRIKGNAETIIKHYVNNNVINCAENRKIENLIITEDKKRGKDTVWQTTIKNNLAETLKEIGQFCQIGWDITLDTSNKNFLFDVIEGKDRSTNQNVNSSVIFAKNFDNINNQTLLHNYINTCNIAYAGGKGEEDEQLIQQIGDQEGFSRRETYIDCSNIETVDELITEGERRLQEQKETLTLESEVIQSDSFIYQKDWDLGDIATVKSDYAVMHTRIVEIKEIYEKSSMELEVTFGDTIPTLAEKIKQLKR